jgi:hypothetical protein
MAENDHLLQVAICAAYRHQIKSDVATPNGKIYSYSSGQFAYNIKPLVEASYNSMRIKALAANYDSAMKASDKYGKSVVDAFYTLPESNADDNEGKATQPA